MFFALLVISVVVTFIATDTLVNKKDLARISRETHPTSIVTPETLHREFCKSLQYTIEIAQVLANEAEAREWHWSHDYYSRHAKHVELFTLPFDYYVNADNKNIPYFFDINR
jgi:hypothetical protein